jgi:cysteine desulfurase
VADIAGFRDAAKAVMASVEVDAIRLKKLQDRLETGLRQTPDVIVFADRVTRLPNTTLFTVPGMKAETAVIGFDLAGIAVSSGSACSSGKVQPSHVLEAMGFGPEFAEGAVRLSLGWSTSDADVDRCIQAWRKLADTLLVGVRRNIA